MSGSTLVCPGATHNYQVTRSCNVSDRYATNGTVINISGKTTTITWSTTASTGNLTAELMQCTTNPPTISAWCDVRIIKPTTPAAFTPSNISIGAQNVTIAVSGGRDVSQYEWQYTLNNDWTTSTSINAGGLVKGVWTINSYNGSNYGSISATTDGNTALQIRVRAKNTSCGSTLYSNWFYFTPQRP